MVSHPHRTHYVKLLLLTLFVASERACAFITSTLTTTSHKQLSTSNIHAATSTDEDSSSSSFPSQISYRAPKKEQIPICFDIESASYPADEAASLESLTTRQSEAIEYFQCATIMNDTDDIIIGYVCGTRCNDFETEESMSNHDPNGPLLAIHSVVVKEEYRRKGVATAMLTHYLEETIKKNSSSTDLQSIVLLSKSHLLGFYVNCGFQVNRPSPIVHGQELWYECELCCYSPSSSIRSLPTADESWFCKTETFKRPFPEVKVHLEAHTQWVQSVRENDGLCITSGYRVDENGRPGGGGLMLFAAKNYNDALQIVLQDPLVANDCVDWQLNGWIGQVGDLQMR